MSDVGVLIPLRIETRFDAGRLRLRLTPDEAWFSRHDPRASGAELDVLERTVHAMAAASDEETRRLAWLDMAGRVTPARAAWLTRTFVQTDAGGEPTVNRPPDADLRKEPSYPHVEGFPKELDVWLARAGGPPARVATLTVDRSRLTTDPPDRTAGETRWWEDWDAAVDVGLATEIGLDGDPNDIDLLLVTGLSEEEPAGLFSAHRDAGTLGLIPPGTPTNTVDGGPAASRGRDPAEWWEALESPATESERLVSLALSGDRDLLGNLPGPDDPQRSLNEAIVAGLWPALWGFAGVDLWAIRPASPEAARWAPGALFPEGPFPTVRVGPQPYGLLPATTLDGWVPRKGDEVESGMPKPLAVLRQEWQRAAEERGTVVGASTEALLDLLGQVPTTARYRHRGAWPLELWWLASLLLGMGIDWDTIDGAWHSRYRLADELGLEPARRYGTRDAPRLLRLPLVRPRELDPDTSVGEVLTTLVKVARRQPSAFANMLVIERELVRLPLASLLLRLAVRSIQVALGDLGRELLGEHPPQPEPAIRQQTRPANLERWIERVTAADLDSGSEAAEGVGRVMEGLMRLTDAPEERLERLLRATLDTAIYRIDPWAVALPARRVQELLDHGDAAMHLGAYGWVDAPRPGAPGPTEAGFLHTPSPAQALTAAVLRDRAVSEPSTSRWHMDLASSTVRGADRLGEEVRAGAHLGEAMGRAVERAAGDTAAIEDLRRNFPLRSEHAGRRTCDGLAVLAADPATLGLGAETLAELDELRRALDGYGDLLVAEAVHQLTRGNADAASGAMDAAAGLGRPPRLDALRTTRDGRAVSTSALLLLPAVAEPPVPADELGAAQLSPATLADGAAASFLADQFGPADSWKWDASTAAGGGGSVAVTLADLAMEPADAVALAPPVLDRLALDAAADALGAPRDEVTLDSRQPSELYDQCARTAALLGRAPAGPEAVAEQPDAVAGGPAATAVRANLAARYARVWQTGDLLASKLDDELSGTLGGEIGSADADHLRRLVEAARRWGIAPDPRPTEPNAPPPPDLLVATADLASELVRARVDAAPLPASVTAMPLQEIAEALAALASPTGQLAVLSRLEAGALPALRRADGSGGSAELDTEWLPVVAAVREPLARLELHQLLAGAASSGAPAALAAWSSKPDDPWQRDAGDSRLLVVAYAGAALDAGALTATDTVAAGMIDRFSEVIPAQNQTTGAAFGFNAPGSRAPQAILLAVSPDVERPLDRETLRDVVLETRSLAHARMARPVDLSAAARGLLPSVLLPAQGRSAISLEAKRN